MQDNQTTLEELTLGESFALIEAIRRDYHGCTEPSKRGFLEALHNKLKASNAILIAGKKDRE